jgi:hypothetical protein
LLCHLLLDAQDSFTDFSATIFDDRWLPIGMRSAQLHNQASRESKFGQSRLELVFVLQLFALLRGEIRLEKNFARIILLTHNDTRCVKEKEESEQGGTGSPHTMTKRYGKPAAGRYSFHRRRELVDRPGKVQSFVCKKRFEF